MKGMNFIILLICISVSLFAQGWKKSDGVAMQKQYGISYSITQQSFIYTSVLYVVRDIEPDLLIVAAAVHIRSNDIRELLPNRNDIPIFSIANFENVGVVDTYSGSTVPRPSRFVTMMIESSDLIKKLKNNGNWQVFISGETWSISTLISGNLP